MSDAVSIRYEHCESNVSSGRLHLRVAEAKENRIQGKLDIALNWMSWWQKEMKHRAADSAPKNLGAIVRIATA